MNILPCWHKAPTVIKDEELHESRFPLISNSVSKVWLSRKATTNTIDNPRRLYQISYSKGSMKILVMDDEVSGFWNTKLDRNFHIGFKKSIVSIRSGFSNPSVAEISISRFINNFCTPWGSPPSGPNHLSDSVILNLEYCKLKNFWIY